MKRIRTGTTALALIALTGILAGCGQYPVAGSNEKETSTSAATGAPTAATTTTAAAELPTVSLMSYNIYYQDVAGRQAKVLDLIGRCDADVFALQEVTKPWLPYLKAFAGDAGYAYYGHGVYGGDMASDNLPSNEQFLPILWKEERYSLEESGYFWCSSTPEVFSSSWPDGVSSNFPRCVNWVRLQDRETQTSFVVLNVHTDPRNAVVRSNTSELIVRRMEALRERYPVVLMGDWNMWAYSDAYNILSTNGYADVRYTARETTRSGSYNWWGRREEAVLCDYIFAGPGVVAKAFEVIEETADGEHISDHYPIMARLVV